MNEQLFNQMLDNGIKKDITTIQFNGEESFYK